MENWINRGCRAADIDSGLEKWLGISSTLSQRIYTDVGTDYAQIDTRKLNTIYNCHKVSI